MLFNVLQDGEERTLFFSDDGSKRIDYVFAYNVLDVVDEKKQSRRALFEDNLRKTGLILEKETIKVWLLRLSL